MPDYHLAIDIGASSGRHVLGHVEDGRMVLEELYRFDNKQLRSAGHDCWDVEMLWESILAGLEACRDAGKVPSTIGIDTWGVDFVLLDANGKLVGDAVAYRDERTQGIPERAARFLMIPDYFNYLLTGVAVNEYTNATTTNMLNARTKDWDAGLLETFGIPTRLFATPQMPGTVLGGLLPEVQRRVGFDAQVVLPATHDTGSAFLAVPARDDDAVYISSGTWSLLGVENEGPITTEAARLQNFTNEGGYAYRFRFLKNIMGLWMNQSIRREFNGVSYVEGAAKSAHALRAEGEPEIGFGDLVAAARQAEDFHAYVNVNDDRFLAPQSMIDEIRLACEETGQPVPETPGQIMRCVYESLTSCYAAAIADLSALTGRTYTSINIVGGGCQDGLLNQMTANACGVPVFAGPIEGTSIGNLIVQFLAAGEFASLQEARDSVRASFSIEEILPVE